MTMQVLINGEPRELQPGATVQTVVAQAATPQRGVAVAVNGEVVPRGRWASTQVADAARIEIVVAVQGG